MKETGRITIYEKPTCTTCRTVHAALRDAGVDFDTVDYYLEPLTAPRLGELIRKTGLRPRDLLRTREDAYAAHQLDDPHLTDDGIIDLMVKHPDLLQRPIVERGTKAMLARPAEKLAAFLKEAT